MEQKNDIADEIVKLAENSKVEELSKKVTEVSSELTKNVSEVAERAEKLLIVDEDEPLDRPASDRVKATIPRTPAQHILRIVSIVLIILGAADVLTTTGSLVSTFMGLQPAVPLERLEFSGVYFTFSNNVLLGYVFVLLIGMLQVITSIFGLRAAKDSSKVEPYRFLCYLIGLIILVGILWAWGRGELIILDPFVQLNTIVYVVICSNLADKVKKEHDQGIVGTTYWRSRHQRVLHFFSLVSIALSGIALFLVLILLGLHDFSRVVNQPVLDTVNQFLEQQGILTIFLVTVGAVFSLIAGLLALKGSNDARFIRPYILAVTVIVLFDIVRIVFTALTQGIPAVNSQDIFELVYNATGWYLAIRIEAGLPNSYGLRLWKKICSNA
jgi:hypothetical protein